MATQFSVNDKKYVLPDTEGIVAVIPKTGVGDFNTPVYIRADGKIAPITSYDGNSASTNKVQTNFLKDLGQCYFVGQETNAAGKKDLKVVPTLSVSILGSQTSDSIRHTELTIGDNKSHSGRIKMYDGSNQNNYGTIFLDKLTEEREYYLPDEDGDVAIKTAGNDYAELRQISGQAKAGQVVKEIGNGELTLTTDRLERGCEIISDVYGFYIGEKDENTSPIAVTGRVLAYPDKDPSTFEIGAPVCSGKNGTVSQMTEEEERLYPSRIIGTVSEIPNYDIWTTKDKKIPVDGRIWIRVR